MPLHDWTLCNSGTYHDFHYSWIATIRNRLNAGLLPDGMFAMAEQIIGGPAPDVVALESWENPAASDSLNCDGLATASPQTTIVLEPPEVEYVRKANMIVVRHELGQVVSVIELVSPGNKHSDFEIQRLTDKSVDLIADGIHLLVIDPFPATSRDPNGMPGLICDQLHGPGHLNVPPEARGTLSSVCAYPRPRVFVEPLSVGTPLPDMPLFLYRDGYITLPIEDTYQQTWSLMPPPVQKQVESGR